MSHVRQQIREAFVTALTGLSATGASVFGSRLYDLEAADLPALLIYSLSEESVPDTVTIPRGVSRELSVIVEARAKGVSGVDDTLDTICAEVENAIGADPTLSGGAQDVYLVSTEIVFDTEGDTPHAQAAMTFAVSYRTRETDAESAI